MAARGLRIAPGAAAGLLSLLLVAAGAGDAGAQGAPPQIIALFAGSNLGSGGDEPLRYAESDARRLRDTLVELGGVARERALLVAGGGEESLWKGLAEARRRAERDVAAGRSVSFYFFYSGHGDDENLHLPGGPVAIAELRRRVGEVPARLRLMVLDACRTGGRSRGAHRGEAFAVIATPRTVEGTVELRASAAGEAAQESDELGGAVFSHFLISGLRGAADDDHDARVTLDELYAYAWRRTLLRTGGGVALQHPEIAVRLAGSGEIVLSQTSTESAYIEVGGGADRYLVFGLPRGIAYGEIGGEGGRINLPAGRFLVIRRRGERPSATEVDLAWGGGRRLLDSDFRALAREELAARGGRLDLLPWRAGAHLAFESLVTGAEPSGFAVGVEAARGFGRLVVGVDLGYCGAPVETVAFGGWRNALGLGAAVGLRGQVWRLTLTGALGGQLRISWETLERPDAARYEAAGLPSREAHAWTAGGPRASIDVALALGHELDIAVFTSVTALVQKELAAGGSALVVRPLVGLGVALRRRF